MIKKMLTSLLLTVVCLALLSSCNTFRGFGKDLQEAGEAIEKAVD